MYQSVGYYPFALSYTYQTVNNPLYGYIIVRGMRNNIRLHDHMDSKRFIVCFTGILAIQVIQNNIRVDCYTNNKLLMILQQISLFGADIYPFYPVIHRFHILFDG